ncbi:hypothetical protein LINPERPRIM_LOCUS18150 [Linum perenne]
MHANCSTKFLTQT